MPSESSSPLKKQAQTGYEAIRLNTANIRTKINREMDGVFLGPIPVKDFLNDFLPKGPKKKPRNVSFAKVAEVSKEKFMYGVFSGVVNDEGILGGKLKMVDTAENSDPDNECGRRIRPDPVLYTLDVDTSKNVTQFDRVELNIEFKLNDAEPFVDEQQKDQGLHPFETQTERGSEHRAQLADYACEIFARQHRLWAFTIFINGKNARFIRWDHAGAIVSARFNYCEDSSPLVDFLWRFAHMTAAQRGHDPQVRLARPDEEELAHKMLAEWNTDEKKRPVVVYTVYDDKMKTDREFLAWKSMTQPKSIIGRCTRAYPVYEKKSEKRYFLKDLWRAHDLNPEAETLCKLEEKQVQNVPKFLCGGDIKDATTQTDLYVPLEDSADASLPPRRPSPWKLGENWNRITRRIHHIFVVDFIGRPLETFENPQQLMQVVSDAFTAHKEAWEKCRILHRDISAKNILITMDGKHGVLNDWDLAKLESELKDPRRHERTGTWQFMSCLILSRKSLDHLIQHDMESFYYVMLYFGLRFLPHNHATSQVRDLLHEIFDHEKPGVNGIVLGGGGKISLLRGDVLAKTFCFTIKPFNNWWTWTHGAVKQWMDYVDLTDEGKPTIQADPPRVTKAPTMYQTPTLALEDLDFSDHTIMAMYFEDALKLEWPPLQPNLKLDAAPKITTQGSRTPSIRQHSNSRVLTDSAASRSSTKRPRGTSELPANDKDSSQGGSKKRRTRTQSAPTRHSARIAGRSSGK